MPSQQMREVISMLEDAGCQKLHHSQGHLSYRLPNGKRFTTSATPSSPLTSTNAIAALRRELRPTHPEIANRGRTLPKNKRTTRTTLGELVGFPGFSSTSAIPAIVAIPGSQPAPPPQLEFQILEPEPEPTPAPEPEILIHHAPRIRREPSPKPSPAKTLTQAQLDEANRILRTQGAECMNVYLDDCRNRMVTATRATAIERQPIVQLAEDDLMQDIFTRTKNELEAVNKRLAQYESQIAAIKTQQDADILKQVQLEQYISKYNALADEATTLLTEVLPPPKPEPAPRAVHTGARPSNLRKRRLSYGIAEIRDKVFPALRSLPEFGQHEVIAGIVDAGMERPPWNIIHCWLLTDARRTTSQIVASSPGRFRFREVANG